MIPMRSSLTIAALALTTLGADLPAPREYVCGKAGGAIEVDGKIDDDAWKDVPWTDDFVDIEGDVKPRPRFRTRVKMVWDETHFYLAAEMVEPHVWGTLTRHDSVIFHDNDFEVFIDPDGDNHEYYEVEINALNTEWDLLLEKPYRDGGPAVNAWEIPGLKTAVHVNGRINDPEGEDESWTVEIAIPWPTLADRAHRPTPPRDGDQWRVNFSRVEWDHVIAGKSYRKVPNRPEANWVWSPQGAIDMHRPERWGYVQFSTDPPGKTLFRPDPSAPVRDRLMTVYHAQKAHQARTKTWAPSLKALGLTDLPPLPNTTPPQLHLTPNGFEAIITQDAPGNHPPRTWTVRQDSRLKHTDN